MNAISGAWLVHRIVGGKLEVLGLYETRDKAQGDIDTMGDLGVNDWQIVGVPFIGWGAFLTDNNDPKPRGN